MAVYDLEEQEQLDEIKTWWRQYGNLVTTVITVVALVLAGWQGWNWWQRKQSAESSAIYMALDQSVRSQDAKKARELAGTLIESYSGTPYAAMGAMLSARAQVEFGDAKTAHLQLKWVAENGKDEVIRDLARLRLATLLLDEKSYDEALKQLAAQPLPALAARFAEVKGDVLAAQGKKTDAAAAYTIALDKLPAGDVQSPHSAYRSMLQIKLDSMGAAK